MSRAMSRTVGFFVPCFVDQLWPQAARAAVELMEALGFELGIADAVCCGQALSNAGESAGAQHLRKLWARRHRPFSEIVVLSASCAGHLLSTSCAGQQVERAPDLPGRPRILEWCEWFAEHAPARFPRPVQQSLALHRSCSSLRPGTSDAAAQDLLGRVDGLRVYQPEHSDECCGFGGSFATEFADLSVRMGRDKIQALEACLSSPASSVSSKQASPELAGGRCEGRAALDGIVSVDCSCLLHLRGIAQNALPCFHVAEVLREAVGGKAAGQELA